MTASRAEADLAGVRADIEHAERRLADLRERAAKIENYLEMARIYDAGGSVAGTHANQPKPGSKGDLYVSTAIALIRELGRPLQTPDLIGRMAERGVVVGGTNPKSNLAGFLSKASELRSLRGIGWDLVGDTKPLDSKSDAGKAPHQDGADDTNIDERDSDRPGDNSDFGGDAKSPSGETALRAAA